MIAFPRHGLKMSKSGNIVTISMTNDPDNSSFKYYAHSRGSTLKDKFYVGAYFGSEVDSKLRSLSGKTVANTKTIATFRILAQANGAPNNNGGSGYDQHGWFQLIYLQAMYCLKYKNLNSQSVIGKGIVAITVNPTPVIPTTGGTNTKGMDWGETTGKEQMKLFGIEDLWGNYWSWIDGFFCNSSRNILTATQEFNDSATGYIDQGNAATDTLNWNFISKVMGTTETGFTPISTSNGSESTYYSDPASLYASNFLEFGGLFNNNTNCGVFCVRIWHQGSKPGNWNGSRLMYL